MRRKLDLSTWIPKAQAAQRLGMSVRQLERLSGTPGFPERRERPVKGRRSQVVFNPADIEAQEALKFQVATLVSGNAGPQTALQVQPPPAVTIYVVDKVLNTMVERTDKIIGALMDRLERMAAQLAAAQLATAQIPPPPPPPPPPETKLFLTIPESGAYTGLSTAYIKRLIKDGRVWPVRDGRRFKLSRVDLDDLVNLAGLSKPFTTNRASSGRR